MHPSERIDKSMVMDYHTSYVIVPENQDTDPTTCTQWKLIDNLSEMENTISTRLQTHFGQAHNCTWTRLPLDVTMDFEGGCNKPKAILTGTYATTEITTTKRWIVNNLTYVIGNKDKIPEQMTQEDLINKLKTWDERRSTSPMTNVHLGRGKSYCVDHSLEPGSQAEQGFSQARQKIIDGHVTLLNYSLQFGYSYTRWHNIVNCWRRISEAQKFTASGSFIYTSGITTYYCA
jgi:hypothetical protein